MMSSRPFMQVVDLKDAQLSNTCQTIKMFQTTLMDDILDVILP
jgi:hypothetical protein